MWNALGTVYHTRYSNALVVVHVVWLNASAHFNVTQVCLYDDRHEVDL